MRKLVKILLIVLGGLVTLFLVAVLAVTLFIDPNDYKDRIEALVENRTGREFTIEGDISLSFFPWIGAETGAATLANAQGFGPEPFARVEHAGVKVRLLPLIGRRVEVDTVILENATVNLARNSQGVTNWQDLVPAGKQPSDTETAGAGIAGLVISGVQLRNSTVTWSDATSDTQYTASGIDLETSEVALGEPFDMRLGLDLKSRAGLDARVSLNATPTVNPAGMTAKLEDFEFTLEGEIRGEDRPMPVNVGMSADAELNLASGSGSFENVQLHAWNVSADGSARLTNLNTAPAYTAELTLEEFSPRELLERVNGEAPETSDGDVLSRAAARLDVEGDMESVQATLADAYLDDTDIAGSFGIDPLAAMAIKFRLDIGVIDLDRYLAPAAEGAGETAPLASPGEAVAAGGSMIPVETLRGLNLDGTMHAERLKVAGVTATDIDVTVTAKDGQVRVHPLEAGFYQGRYTGDVRIDASGERPKLSMNERLQGVQAGPLLADAAGRNWMTGLGGMSLTSTADLSSPEAAKRSLSGHFEFDFRDGAIFGINIAQRIRQAVSLLQGDSVNLEAGEAKTDFSTFQVNADMEGGVIRTNTVRLISPLLQISGGGTIDLAGNSVDLTFTPVLSEALAEQAGGTIRGLAGKPIPLKFSGSLLQPKISLDVASVVQQRAEDEVRQRLGQELLKALGDREEQDEAAEEDGTAQQDDGMTADERKAQRQAERRKARREAREAGQSDDDGGG